MNEARLPWIQIAPKAYQAMAAVGTITSQSTLGMPLIELVQTRVSQINGCAFCVDMHARDLRKHGETWQRINSLSTGMYGARIRRIPSTLASERTGGVATRFLTASSVE